MLALYSLALYSNVCWQNLVMKFFMLLGQRRPPSLPPKFAHPSTRLAIYQTFGIIYRYLKHWLFRQLVIWNCGMTNVISNYVRSISKYSNKELRYIFVVPFGTTNVKVSSIFLSLRIIFSRYFTLRGLRAKDPSYTPDKKSTFFIKCFGVSSASVK